jgi:hypothetical protein
MLLLFFLFHFLVYDATKIIQMSALYGKIRQVGAWHTGPPTTIRRQPIGCFHRRPTGSGRREPVAKKMPITHTQRCETNTPNFTAHERPNCSQSTHQLDLRLQFNFTSIKSRKRIISNVVPWECRNIFSEKNELKSKIIKKNKKGKRIRSLPETAPLPRVAHLGERETDLSVGEAASLLALVPGPWLFRLSPRRESRLTWLPASCKRRQPH